MEKFIMVGKYSAESIKDISSNRTERAVRLIKELGGKVHEIYALLGGFDVVLIVDLKDSKTAMKASLGLMLLTGIAFSTYPAVSVKDFDRMLEK